MNMGKVDKIIDLNAHIEDLKYEICVQNGEAIAEISFSNLEYGDITAIKFNARGYNAFNELVLVNGRTRFFLIIQDVVIKKNGKATNLRVKLPNADIKKLDLEECQICYADGSVISYDGKNKFSFELEEIDNNEQLKALHKLFDENAKYKCKKFKQGWICTCGRLNKPENNICSKCSKSRSDVFKVCSDDGLKKLVKQMDNRYILMAIAAVICVILAFPIGHAIQISQRTTYASEDEMKEALQGTWTCYGTGYSAKYKVNIKDDTLIKRFVKLGSDSDLDFTIEEWNPKEGTFTISLGTYTVLSNGNIKDKDGNEFKKGGGWSTTSSGSSSTTTSYESARTALQFTDISITTNSNYTICTGKVKNNGKKTYKYVTIKGSFKDASGNVLDTDSTYAVGSEGLAPGESTSFRLSVHKDLKITKCSITIIDYDKGG